MKKTTLTLLLILATTLAWAGDKEVCLTKAQTEAVTKEVVDAWKASEKARLAYIMTDMAVKVDTIVMPIHGQIYGDKPADGRALFISLHGGGKTTEQVNTEQWHNQWTLYKPKEGVYLCPRAPYDDWDMHFKPLLNKCYRDVINFCVTYLDVNPDKVYILGYSAGGDGVWRMAPRMADTWAAASMMAGHPGDVRLENLRNTPFSVWCGALDKAYDRNKVDAQRIKQLDSLQRQDSDGYKHYGRIVEGKGHWMNQVDTFAISWMEQFKRDPYPKKIVWHQEENQGPVFYWLKVEPEEVARHKEVRASYEGNTVTITKCDYKRLTVCLNDRMMDLDKPVKIMLNGVKIMDGKVKRTRKNIKGNLKLRQDERYAFPTEIHITQETKVETSEETRTYGAIRVTPEKGAKTTTTSVKVVY